MHQTEVRFEGVPTSVSAARHLVSEILDAAGAPEQCWSAAQIVSELATNAIIHAGTDFVVRLTVAESVVRIAVTDGRPSALATKRRFSTETTTGRGLRLVETLSRSWGVDAAESSKTVWCELVRMHDGRDDSERDYDSEHNYDSDREYGDSEFPSGYPGFGDSPLVARPANDTRAIVRDWVA